MTNDVIGLINKTVEEFDTQTIAVIPDYQDKSDNIRYLSEQTGGYMFSQRQMLTDIDLAYNSQFKSGKYDREGKRKLFLNIMRFYVNVAVKNTDIDTKNFVLRPTDNSTENQWAVWFFHRQFKNWVKDSGFAKVINDLNFDFNKYGTCVLKQVKDDIVRIPLRTLRCDQSAVTLRDGIEGGTPLVQEHNLSYFQMSKFGWELPDEFTNKRKVYESYVYMYPSDLLELQGTPKGKEAEGKEQKQVLCMVVYMPSGQDEKDRRKKYAEKVLFAEQVDDIPYQECHSEKQDGRWLAIGNCEKQIENQIARNATVNLRQRSMLWASKQIFQTQGDAVQKNLVKNVQDGEVLQVGLNGLIQKVDTSTRSLGDYSQDEQVWEDNSQKQAFAFESATGESFSSGTPFRLGAMLSNSVMGYFDQQKEIFALFLKESFYSEILPIFKRRAKDDIVLIGQTEEGYNKLKEMFVDFNANQQYIDMMTSGSIFDMNIVPSMDEVKMGVENQLIKSPYLSVAIPKDVYKNAKYSVDLDITGESEEPADKETLTTLYTTLSQKGDPRADKVLEVLLASMGKNLSAIAGNTPKSMPTANPVAATGQQNPDLQGLIPQNATNA